MVWTQFTETPGAALQQDGRVAEVACSVQQCCDYKLYEAAVPSQL